MAYTPIESRLGVQPIAFGNVGNTLFQSGQSPFLNKEHPLGTIIRAYDPVYGEGEFIYLQMVGGQSPGHLVTWGGYGAVVGDGATLEAQYQAALTTNTAGQSRPVGVAMAGYPTAVGGLQPTAAFGWYQIAGNAVVFTNNTATGAPTRIYQSATAGLVTSTQANGLQIVNSQLVQAVGTPANVNVASAVVAAGGTGYVTGQIVNVSGGTGIIGQAQLTVTASAGVITGLAVYEAGFYTTLPTSPVTLSGGTATAGLNGTATLTSQAPFAIAAIQRPFLQGQVV